MAFARGEVGPADGDGVGTHDLDLEVARAHRHGDAEHAATGPGDGHVDGQRFEWHGPHQLDRQPGDAELVARAALDDPCHQCGDRAAVLMARIPRSAGVLGGEEIGTARCEQRLVGHPCEPTGQHVWTESAGAPRIVRWRFGPDEGPARPAA